MRERRHGRAGARRRARARARQAAALALAGRDERAALGRVPDAAARDRARRRLCRRERPARPPRAVLGARAARVRRTPPRRQGCATSSKCTCCAARRALYDACLAPLLPPLLEHVVRRLELSWAAQARRAAPAAASGGTRAPRGRARPSTSSRSGRVRPARATTARLVVPRATDAATAGLRSTRRAPRSSRACTSMLQPRSRCAEARPHPARGHDARAPRGRRAAVRPPIRPRSRTPTRSARSYTHARPEREAGRSRRCAMRGASAAIGWADTRAARAACACAPRSSSAASAACRPPTRKEQRERVVRRRRRRGRRRRWRRPCTTSGPRPAAPPAATTPARRFPPPRRRCRSANYFGAALRGVVVAPSWAMAGIEYDALILLPPIPTAGRPRPHTDRARALGGPAAAAVPPLRELRRRLQSTTCTRWRSTPSHIVQGEGAVVTSRASARRAARLMSTTSRRPCGRGVRDDERRRTRSSPPRREGRRRPAVGDDDDDRRRLFLADDGRALDAGPRPRPRRSRHPRARRRRGSAPDASRGPPRSSINPAD